MNTAGQDVWRDDTMAGLRSSQVGRWSFTQIAAAAMFIGLLAALIAGVSLETPIVTSFTAALILVAGLPHGTFDLALIKRAHAHHRVAGVFALYIGCAAAMYGAWLLSPPMALAFFFISSVVHFADDWTEALPPFFAHGIAAALLTAPAFLQHAALTSLFAMLVGHAAAATLAAVSLMIAPVALAIAAVGIAILWSEQRRSFAITTAIAVGSMILLPPVVGFALFFCMLHSPMHFSAAQQTLGWKAARQWAPTVVILTAAALGIAAFIFATAAAFTVTDAVITTVFMTLSVLTLPHMAVPVLLARFNSYRTRSV